MKNECPSCGYVFEYGQLFCPACGRQRKIENEKKKNGALEQELLRVDNFAEVCLSKKLGAGISGSVNYENLHKCEGAYVEIVEKYPLESKPYIAYVDYMIKYVVKINSLTSVFATTQYFIGDLDGIIERCRKYLAKAREMADESEFEKISHLDNLLTEKLDTINKDDSIKIKQRKNEKIANWCWIGTGILFGALFLCWVIADILGS